MTPVTVYVPDEQLGFFNELMNNLHFKQEIEDIPEWHKTIIDQRQEEYARNPADLLNWDEVKHTFKV